MNRLIFVALLFFAFSSFSQSILTEKKLNLTFSGFVRNDFIIDSRHNVDGIEELFTYWPRRPEYDANGKDIYRHGSAKMLNIFTRFGTRFTGLELGTAKVSAYVEVDFTGSTATNSLRLRHVYSLFDWPKTTLLFGNTWHPTFIEKVFPGVIAINTGMPFQVFNRSPQLRLTQHLSTNLDLIAAAVYQSNYVNIGPLGSDFQFQRDALIPNLHLQLQYYNKKVVMGAAVDWKMIRPRHFTTGSGNKIYKTDEKLGSMAALAYFKYTQGKFEFKAKSMYGQNVTESLFPGGFAVSKLDATTGHETYTPSNHIFSFINLTYGETWKVGLFAGYAKNLGFSDNPLSAIQIYGRGNDIDALFRISPQISYKIKNFMLSWEPDHTMAAYGTIESGNKGKISVTNRVTNFRSLFAVHYYF